MTALSNKLIAQEISKRFIARRDVKARQFSGGGYVPVTTDGKVDSPRLPWKLQDLLDHLDGKSSFGHYILDTEDNCKLFAFDIDLERNNPTTGFTGFLPNAPMPGSNQKGADPWPSDDEIKWWERNAFVPTDAREAWRDWKHPGRYWMKVQFREIASKLMRAIHEELEIPCAAAYSGSKGIHVYGFTGYHSAADARLAANIVLEVLGEFEPTRGTNFFKHKNQHPVDGYPNISIEVFPKQNSLSGKDLGNLMRLPLGRNLKTTDPTFFLDMTAPMGSLTPVDPLWALTEGALNPWKRPGE